MNMFARLPMLILLLCGVALTAIATEPAANKSAVPEVLLADDFDGDIQNALFGFRNAFAAVPSTAKSLRTDQSFRGKTGKSLRLEVSRREAGFCGAWIHFFDMHAEAPRYFDASDYAYLSFWVRGESGGESFTVQLADKTWIRKQDSVRQGEVADFLKGGVTTKWQEVLVPLHHQDGLNLHELGGLTLNFQSPGKAVIFVDDVSFKRRIDAENSEILESRVSKPSKGQVQSRGGPLLPRALWVWTSKTIVADEKQSRELLEFCQQEQINQLWMQLDYKIEPGGMGEIHRETRCLIANEKQWRNFLSEAHSRSIRVDALDGAPEYAVKENHHIPLAVVDGIIKFNTASPRDQRFDGIHFDNEPYLLLGWEDQNLREKILQEFLQLNVECQRRVTAVRKSKEEFRFGVDIPFWWQEREDPKADFPGDVTFQGLRQPASFHCLDRLDVVGIMNYRDTADGPDGMIYHGRGILTHPFGKGQAEVYMGIETITADPAEVQFIVGLPREQFRAALRGNAKHLANLCRLHGLRLQRFDDGQRVHIGIERPKNPSTKQLTIAATALSEIAKHFAIGADSESKEQLEAIQSRAAAAIQGTGEWRDFATRNVCLREGEPTVPGFRVVAIMPSKCTFAEQSPAELRAQIGLAEQDFLRFPAYRGLAVHSYESYRPKVAEDNPPQPVRTVKRKLPE